jgi:hypothetical protein
MSVETFVFQDGHRHDVRHLAHQYERGQVLLELLTGLLLGTTLSGSLSAAFSVLLGNRFRRGAGTDVLLPYLFRNRVPEATVEEVPMPPSFPSHPWPPIRCATTLQLAPAASQVIVPHPHENVTINRTMTMTKASFPSRSLTR